ncbi:putative leucine-rich repeat domain, L domain-containing protein [Lupinus albus]|uniref:Putative leucine-rich repeat domain, L domain-containing protein n=1 Tax=Lupinus albus TaxID=3870 RepID=A0A6A4R4T9_LUPAL|nr:putative leucine-rich repeat domain, L domain-containing protein [Lupinus albus]
MPILEDLDISDNFIGDEGIRNLIPLFDGTSGMCSHLVCLKVETCELSYVGVSHLLDALSNFKGPLKSLSVADNYLGSQVAEALGNFLSTPIEELDIAGIGLGSSGFQELQNLMKEDLKLVKIDISKNRGGIKTAKFLSTLLPKAPQLIDVNAASNLMPIESLDIISSALKLAKGNFERLDLTGHTWDYKPEHASLHSEFVHDGNPILILPSPSAFAAPYDDDP